MCLQLRRQTNQQGNKTMKTTEYTYDDAGNTATIPAYIPESDMEAVLLQRMLGAAINFRNADDSRINAHYGVISENDSSPVCEVRVLSHHGDGWFEIIAQMGDDIADLLDPAQTIRGAARLTVHCGVIGWEYKDVSGPRLWSALSGHKIIVR